MSDNVGSILQQLLGRIITLENVVNRIKTRDGGRIIRSKPVTVIAGSITVDRGYLIIGAETGTTDSLTNIAATTDGKTVTLRVAATHTITVTDGGNLDLAGNFVMTGSDTISLIYDKDLALWLETSRSVN